MDKRHGKEGTGKRRTKNYTPVPGDEAGEQRKDGEVRPYLPDNPERVGKSRDGECKNTKEPICVPCQ